jgi:hypothetical protein
MTGDRAIKYRRLALASTDPETTRLLCQLADEADRGVLATSYWCSASPRVQSDPAPVVIDGVAINTYVPIGRI